MGVHAVSKPAIFLDRDGVLVETRVDAAGVPHPPSSPGEMRLASGAEQGCRRLRDAGYTLVVVTNQPDVARGTTDRETVEQINSLLRDRLEIDDLRVCYHADADACVCRKPKPGMILAAETELGLDLSRSVMIGDRWMDVEAGRRAGCKTVLIPRSYSGAERVEPTFVAGSFLAAAEWILQHSRP